MSNNLLPSRKTWMRLLAILAFLLPSALCSAQATYIVSLTTDSAVPAPGELRHAINLANTDGQDSIITFTTPPGTVITLQQGPLLILIEDRTWIQGPGPGQLQIDANGAAQAFVIATSGNAISGLAIFNADQEQILIDGTVVGVPAMTNWIYDCHIGINSIGIAAGVNRRGVRIAGDNAAYNLVGTDGVPAGPGPGGTPGMCGELGAPPPPINIATGAPTNTGERCIISNNVSLTPPGPAAGVYIDNGAYSNRVAGNYIGTDLSGTAAIPNHHGVLINLALENCVGISDDTAPINYLAGGEADEGNLISGNDWNAVTIDASHSNWVAGNIIGLDITGNAAIPNLQNGVEIFASSQNNVVGTDGDGTADAVPGAPTGGERNIISANGAFGIRLATNAFFTRIKGNYIGTDITGMLPRGNTRSGIEVDTSPQTVIGTDADGTSDALETNVISGNLESGVYIVSNQVLVWGNIIGLDAAEGTLGGNTLHGVLLNGAIATSIGMDLANLGAFLPTPTPPSYIQRNVISDNGSHGILLTGTTTAGNMIIGNFIGTDSTGNNPFGNGGHGVLAQLGASNNTIGFTWGGPLIPSNTIRYNSGDGIRVAGMTNPTNSITILGNSINSNAGIAIENINTGNTEETPPAVTNIDFAGQTVSGTSVAEDSSVVEVFWDDADEALGYLGSTTVTGGSWSLTGITWPAVPTFYVTANVTDTSGNTSELTLGGATTVETWIKLDP